MKKFIDSAKDINDWFACKSKSDRRIAVRFMLEHYELLTKQL